MTRISSALAADFILNFNSDRRCIPTFTRMVGLHYVNNYMEIEEIGCNGTGRDRRFIGILCAVRKKKKH